MAEKTLEEYTLELKRLLGEKPEQGWIFGVCATLAKRTGWELWLVRLIAAFGLLTFTLLTSFVYFCLAMGFQETRPHAQAKMMRWARRLDQVVAALGRGLKKAFSEKSDHGARSHLA